MKKLTILLSCLGLAATLGFVLDTEPAQARIAPSPGGPTCYAAFLELAPRTDSCQSASDECCADPIHFRHKFLGTDPPTSPAILCAGVGPFAQQAEADGWVVCSSECRSTPNCNVM